MPPLATAFAAGRVALGISASPPPAPSVGSSGWAPILSPVSPVGILGGRDLVLGLGMILGARHGSARGWYEGAAVVDLIDSGTTVLAGARGSIPAKHAAAVAVLAAANGAVALYLARTVDEGATPRADPSPDELEPAR
ncbi:MAG: hypothetical protein U5R31_15920 [Acidimicrobiia bacterium]|nr:hypothetical protein [Acidimicrobiia bacterium]